MFEAYRIFCFTAAIFCLKSLLSSGCFCNLWNTELFVSSILVNTIMNEMKAFSKVLVAIYCIMGERKN